MFALHRKTEMPRPEEALPGRDKEMSIDNIHHALGGVIKPPFPDNAQQPPYFPK